MTRGILAAWLGGVALLACSDGGADRATDTAAPGDTVADTVADSTPSQDSSPETSAETDAAADADTTSDSSTDTISDSSADADTSGDSAADTTSDSSVDADTSGDSTLDTTSDSSADTLDVGPGFRAALRQQLITGHVPLGYNGARDRMYAHGGIDDHDGRITCIYTGRTVDTDTSRTPGDHCELADGEATRCDFNTEHTWPRYYLRLALTDGSEAYRAAEGDLHHLFPSDSDFNNARWHFDFGTTTCREDGNCKLDEGSALGLRAGVDGQSWCPTGNLELDKQCVIMVRAERRGDIARSQFYMAVRYGMAMDDEIEQTLRAWHVSDPPDALERARNDAIEQDQGNRNPFIDDPANVARIADY